MRLLALFLLSPAPNEFTDMDMQGVANTGQRHTTLDASTAGIRRGNPANFEGEFFFCWCNYRASWTCPNLSKSALKRSISEEDEQNV
jgi:hypothetical protein